MASPALFLFIELTAALNLLAGTTGYVTTADQTVSVFPSSLGRESASFLAGAGAGQIVFSPDGSTLFIGQFTAKGIEVVDATTHVILKQIAAPVEVTTLTVSPDGKTVYFGGVGASSVYTLDVASGKVLARVQTPSKGTVNCLALSPGGETLYVSYGVAPPYTPLSCGSYLSPFDAPGGMLSASTSTFQVLTHFDTGGQPVIAMAPTGDGSAVSVAIDREISRLDTKTGAIEKSISLPSTPIADLKRVPNQAGVAAALVGSPVVLLDPVTLSTIRTNEQVQATNLAFSADGATCFFANTSSAAPVVGSFATRSFAGVSNLRRFGLPLYALAVSPANGEVFVTNANFASFSFDAATGTLGGFLETTGYVPLVPGSGGRVVYNYAKLPGLQAYQPGQSLPSKEIAFHSGYRFASALFLSGDGSTGFAGLEGSGTFSAHVAVAKVSLPSGATQSIFPLPTALQQNSFYFAGVSPDGFVLYFQSQFDISGPLHLAAWDLRSGSLAQGRLAGGTPNPLALPISSDGKYAYAYTTQAISRLDALTLKVLATYPLTNAGGLLETTVSADGARVYVVIFNESDEGSRVVELDANSLMELRTLNSAERYLSFALTPDGSRAYAPVSGTTSMAVLDLAAFQLLAPIALPAQGTFAVLPRQ